MIRHKLFQMSMFLILTGCASFVNLNAQNLEKYTWKKRILVIKTSDSASEIYQEQIKEFSNSTDELKDRKFVLYKITGGDFELINFTNTEMSDAGNIAGKPIEMILNDKENNCRYPLFFFL